MPRTSNRPQKLLDTTPLQPREGYADRAEVAEFAQTLTISHLECREMGHNWKRWIARWIPEQHAYERALRCVRCRTERWQLLSDSGAVLPGGGYKYPDGYQHQGLGRIVGEGRDALRLESLRRDLEKEAS